MCGCVNICGIVVDLSDLDPPYLGRVSMHIHVLYASCSVPLPQVAAAASNLKAKAIPPKKSKGKVFGGYCVGDDGVMGGAGPGW